MMGNLVGQGGLLAVAVYLAAINVVTFVGFCIDKRRAVRGAYRIPERTLIALSFAGGALGGLVAMRLVRHKTRKWYFAWGLPLFLLLQIAGLVGLGVAGVI